MEAKVVKKTLLVAFTLVACGSDPTVVQQNPVDGGGGADSNVDSSQASDSSAQQDSSPVDSSPPNNNVTLGISNGKFTNAKGVGGNYYYSVNFSLDDTSMVDVVSLDTMTLDFGGGNQVSLTKPPCSGSFAIAAGSSRAVKTQIGVTPSTGTLNQFSIICGSSQYFGGANGKAPPIDTFPGPINITVGGTTKSGTFTAVGQATL